MKSLLATITIAAFMLGSMSFKPVPCGKYNGRNIYKGEKGGCYYLKGKKKEKVYIDKAHCKC